MVLEPLDAKFGILVLSKATYQLSPLLLSQLQAIPSPRSLARGLCQDDRSPGLSIKGDQL